MWCESLVHNSSYCLVIVQQSHSCLHQAVMVWPSACQSHWADKFDVIIPRQWTWSPVYGPCLCITAPLSLRSVSWTHFGENRACVCSCQFLLLCSCASVHIEGSMVNKRSAGGVSVSVCVHVSMCTTSSDTPARSALSVLLVVGKSDHFALYHSVMCMIRVLSRV